MAHKRLSSAVAAVAVVLAVVAAGSSLRPAMVLGQDGTPDAARQQVEALLAERKWSAAIDAAKRYVEQTGRLYGTADPRHAGALYLLGKGYDQANELGDGRYRQAEQALKQAITIYMVDPGPTAIVTGEAIHRLADVYDSIGDPKQAYPLAKQAYEIRKSHDPEGRDTATSLELIGVIERSERKFAEAEKTITDALALRRKIFGAEAPEYANTLYVLAGILYDRQQMSAALPRYRDIADILEKNRGSPETETMLGNTYLQLADISRKLESFTDAENYFSRAIEVREKLFGSNHTTVAAAYEKFAQHQAARANKEGAGRTLARAIAIYMAQQPPNQVRAANAMSNLAYVFSEQQWLKEAEDLHRQALEIRRVHDKGRVSQSLMSIAAVERTQELPAAAEKTINEALAYIRSSPSPSQGLIVSAEIILAGIHSDAGRYDKAEPLAKAALDYRIRLLGRDADAVALSHNALGGIQRAMGKFDEAEANYRRAMEIRIKQYTSEHAMVAGLLSNLGGLNRARKRYPEAEQDYLKALAIYRRSNPDNPAQAPTLINLAVVLADQGRLDDAIAHMENALRLRRVNAPEAGDPRITSAEAQLAEFYVRRERFKDAEILLEQSIGNQTKRSRETDVVLAASYERLAEVYRRAGRKDKVADEKTLLSAAFEARRKLQGPQHESTIITQFLLADAYRRLGNDTEQSRLIRLARELGRKNFKTLSIMFATDRKLQQKAGSPRTFGTSIGDGVSTGIYPIEVLLGQASSASVQRVDEKGEVSEPVVESSVTPTLDKRPWIDALPAAVIEAATRTMRSPGLYKDQALLFVHGFNVEFEEAIDFAANLALNINFNGGVFLYSWPSNGSPGPASYISDVKRSEASATHLAGYIENVISKTGARKVHIVAHSMGNRVLLLALKELALRMPADRLRIGSGGLASPDVDHNNFRQNVPKARQFGGEPTLYTSSKDWILRLSGVVSRDAAAGYFNPKEGPLVMEGLATVDITSTGTWNSSNHSTFAKNPQLLNDITVMLARSENSPDKRSNNFVAKTLPSGKGSYWAFGEQVPVKPK